MKLSRQKAIEAKCRDCIVDELDTGTWRAQVTDCTDEACALHEYRPLDAKAADLAKKERYEALSDEEKAIYDKRAKEAGDRLRGLNNEFSS